MQGKIAPDKWRHFYAGIILGGVLQGVFWTLLPGRPAMATAAAFGLTVAVSYGFELFSLVTGKGHHDFMDAVASIIGGVLGIGGVWLLQWW